MTEEKGNTMNGYQIRLELLKMSKDLADQEYMMARELIMAPYYSQLGDRKEDGTVEPIPVPAIPDFPTPDYIISLAEKLNEFAIKK